MMSSSPSPPASSNRDRGEEYVTQQRPPAQQDFESRPSVLPRYTDHPYQDYSTYIEDGGRLQKHKKSERNFPAHLHAMLSDEQHSHIISWMPHGRAFKVLDKKLLVEEAIPKYFGQSKYPSFTRQLSGWGFKRLIRAGPNFGCYYHECFLRGHPRLTILMRRIPSGQGKATPNTDEGPDFYVIAEQYPLEKSADMARKPAAAPDMESLSNHQWDQYQHYSTLLPQPQPQLDAPYGDAVYWCEGNTVNQPTTSSGQYHSFASADVGTGAAKKEGDDDQTTKSSAQDMKNYDHFLVSNHHFGAPYASAVNWCEGNTVNQPTTTTTTSLGQYHPFASAGVGTGAAKKEGDDDQTTKSSAQDVMNHAPFSMSNHHFDAPYASAVNWCEGNTVNQPTTTTTSLGQYQYHPFASAGVGAGAVAAKKQGDDQTKSSSQDGMNHDPFPVSNHHFDAPYASALNWCEGNTVNQPTTTTSLGQYHPFASAGVGAGAGAAKKQGDDQTKSSAQDGINYDPFPVSNHHLDTHRGYPMHPAHLGADTNQYSSGSNINQYASGSSHQAVAAAGYYYSQPGHSQQHEAHNGNNMLNHNYGYSNPYYNYSNHYSAQAQGLVEGNSQHSQPSGSRSSAVAAQLNQPAAQGFHDHNYNSSFPSFSPLKTSFQEDDEESEAAAKDSTTQS